MPGRTRLRRIASLAVALLVATASPGVAQAPGAVGAFTLTRAAIQTHRQAIVTEALDLDPQQTQTFWPLYREYRQAMRKIDARLVTLLSRYLESYPDLSAAVAGQLLDESLGIEETRSRVRREYVSRFRKVLPDSQVIRFLQVERRLDAVVDAELAARVPLVE